MTYYLVLLYVIQINADFRAFDEISKIINLQNLQKECKTCKKITNSNFESKLVPRKISVPKNST